MSRHPGAGPARLFRRAGPYALDRAGRPWGRGFHRPWSECHHAGKASDRRTRIPRLVEPVRDHPAPLGNTRHPTRTGPEEPFVPTDIRPDATEELAALLRERILVIDGAMGTMIQQHKLDEDQYRGLLMQDHPSDLTGDNDL